MLKCLKQTSRNNEKDKKLKYPFHFISKNPTRLTCLTNHRGMYCHPLHLNSLKIMYIYTAKQLCLFLVRTDIHPNTRCCSHNPSHKYLIFSFTKRMVSRRLSLLASVPALASILVTLSVLHYVTNIFLSIE